MEQLKRLECVENKILTYIINQMHEYSNILLKRKICKIFSELKSKIKSVFILKTDTRWKWVHMGAHILLIMCRSCRYNRSNPKPKESNVSVFSLLVEWNTEE
jgi:hypothetical protein